MPIPNVTRKPGLKTELPQFQLVKEEYLTMELFDVSDAGLTNLFIINTQILDRAELTACALRLWCNARALAGADAEEIGWIDGNVKEFERTVANRCADVQAVEIEMRSRDIAREREAEAVLRAEAENAAAGGLSDEDEDALRAAALEMELDSEPDDELQAASDERAELEREYYPDDGTEPSV